MKILLSPIEDLIINFCQSKKVPVRNSARFTLTQYEDVIYLSVSSEFYGIGGYWIAEYKRRSLFYLIKGTEIYDNQPVTKLYFKPGILKPRAVNREFLELITGDLVLAEAILLLDEQEKFVANKFTRITVLGKDV